MASLNGLKLAAARWLMQGMASSSTSLKANPVGKVMMAGLQLFGPSVRNPRQMVQEGYQQNVAVYRCIKEICTAMSTIKVEAVRTRKNGEDEVLSAHPLLSLMRRPNPKETWADFITHLITDWRITGEYFICRTPSSAGTLPAELWLLPPASMRVRGGNTGMAAEYEYQGQSGVMRFPVDDKTGECLIYHGMEYNPNDQWRGQSPLMAAGLSIDILNHGLIWNKALLKNGARPTGALIIPTTVNADDYARMQEEIEVLYSGGGNAGRPLLLDGGLDWKDMGTTPKDMDFANSMKEMAQQIASALGVPFALVNPDSATYSNMETANLMLYEKTVVPLLNSVLTGMNMWLASSQRDGVVLRINEDSISALEPRRTAKATRMASLAEKGILTRDEVRQELGYSALGGLSATLLIQSSLLPIEDAGMIDAATSQALPADAEADAVKRALLDSGYTEDEAAQALATQFNMKASACTNFPMSGMNEPLSIRSSLYPEADIELARTIRRSYPELWARGGDAAVLGMRMREAGEPSPSFLRARERMGARKDGSLAGAVVRLAWGLCTDEARTLLMDEMAFYDAKRGAPATAITAGAFVRDKDGRCGRVLVVSDGKATIRTWERAGDAWMVAGIGTAQLSQLSMIDPLE